MPTLRQAGNEIIHLTEATSSATSILVDSVLFGSASEDLMHCPTAPTSMNIWWTGDSQVQAQRTK